MSRRTLINLIFFNGVFAVMLFWAFNNIVSWDRLEQPYSITGDFAAGRWRPVQRRGHLPRGALRPGVQRRPASTTACASP